MFLRKDLAQPSEVILFYEHAHMQRQASTVDPQGCSHSVLEITFPAPIICLSLLRVGRKAEHHIGPPQSLCRILPCHIMALYQKRTPYWPSSIIYAAYCLAILWHYTKRAYHIGLPQSFVPHIALPYYGM